MNRYFKTILFVVLTVIIIYKTHFDIGYSERVQQVVHAYPFTIHTETSDLEDMVRGLNISSTLARRFSKPLSISAKTIDVPGQSWLIHTLFTHAGSQQTGSKYQAAKLEVWTSLTLLKRYGKFIDRVWYCIARCPDCESWRTG